MLEGEIRAKLTSLAECEHRRWNAAMLIDRNVPPTSVPDSHLYKWLRKTATVHSDLKPFDKLTPEVRGIDYALMFNLPDVIEAAGIGLVPISDSE